MNLWLMCVGVWGKYKFTYIFLYTNKNTIPRKCMLKGNTFCREELCKRFLFGCGREQRPGHGFYVNIQSLLMNSKCL